MMFKLGNHVCGIWPVTRITFFMNFDLYGKKRPFKNMRSMKSRPRVDSGGLFHLLQFLLDRKRAIGLRRYVEKLQAVVAKTCHIIGLQGCKVISEFPGLWVGPKGKERKVCAVGVRAGRSIVSHGIALNCNVDLSWFEHIVPCGLEGKGVTSLTQELDRYVPIGDVVPAFLMAFSEEYKCQLCEFPVNLINKLSKELEEKS
ncbi:putative lipoyltransferase 2, mitochondrial isoform X2 [Ischnura elegans]|uniref:putative lipoyltransferase 2, mitochondrial isoform X2 n=1 Tax=Ischnura elegans TaxID=197161 RepID=UPI001ED87E54|nr:putative lipoyltransferase 2, mitochondrial isoform X2 [Ischnura elegans]